MVFFCFLFDTRAATGSTARRDWPAVEIDQEGREIGKRHGVGRNFHVAGAPGEIGRAGDGKRVGDVLGKILHAVSLHVLPVKPLQFRKHRNILFGEVFAQLPAQGTVIGEGDAFVVAGGIDGRENHKEVLTGAELDIVSGVKPAETQQANRGEGKVCFKTY